MSVMTTQRKEWKDYLDAIPYFDDIPILVEDKGDVSNETLRRLGTLVGDESQTKCGIVIILGTVNAIPETNAEFGPVLSIKHIARVIENVEINRDADKNGTLLPYSDVIEKLVGYSHVQFKPASGASPFMIEVPGIQEIDERFLQHVPTGPGKDAFFNCTGQFTNILDQCALPVIVNNAGEISLTCTTPGAAIFYTLDGKKPSPRKTVYTEPFTPDAGVTVKARAWLAGYLASEIATINL